MRPRPRAAIVLPAEGLSRARRTARAFRAVVRIVPRPEPPSGLSNAELAALNRALDRLMRAGLPEHAAKMKLDGAVRTWLQPNDAGIADFDQLLKGHEDAP